MAPQMDRPARLGEARCEISRGEQAKGGGAVLKRLGGILLNPPCQFGLVCAGSPGPDSGCLISSRLLPRTKSRRVEAALGLPSALCPWMRPFHETARCYAGIHCTKVMAGLQEAEPTYFAHKQGVREVLHTYGFWLVEQFPIGISETGK